MVVDYHVHSNLTPDVAKDMSVPNIAQTAKDKGLEKVGITNHLIFEEIYHDTNMPTIEPRQIDDYIEECGKVEEKTDISVKPSLEIDYSSEFKNEIKDLLDSYNLEFTMGAVHLLELDGKYYNIGIAESNESKNIGMLTQTDYLKIVGEEELWENYFDKQIKVVKSGLFDVLAHPDLPKKPAKLSYKFDDYKNHAENLIDVLLDARYNTCVEISGLKAPINELLPSYTFLKTLKEKSMKKGIRPRVSIGSDAHKLGDVGRNIDKAIDIANKFGLEILS
jgi:histidinol-phosphatase (PHP family)